MPYAGLTVVATSTALTGLTCSLEKACEGKQGFARHLNVAFAKLLSLFTYLLTLLRNHARFEKLLTLFTYLDARHKTDIHDIKQFIS